RAPPLHRSPLLAVLDGVDEVPYRRVPRVRSFKVRRMTGAWHLHVARSRRQLVRDADQRRVDDAVLVADEPEDWDAAVDKPLRGGAAVVHHAPRRLQEVPMPLRV